MQTRYTLHINGNEYVLRDDDLRNWSDIKCSYKRSDYDGVVRSFSSQFEFVNKAYELLLSAYLADGVNASATISVATMNDRWTFDEMFSCPLDFSTISWSGGVLSINSVDNSLAALIKANKGTTYDFAVGQDIATAGMLTFDRIPMSESVRYAFTQGVSYDDSADIMVSFNTGTPPWVGCVADEIAVNGAIFWNDDQEDNDNGYALKAYKDITVTLDWSFAWWTNRGKGGVNLGVRIKRNGKYVDSVVDATDGNGGYFCTAAYAEPKLVGKFTSSKELPAVDTLPENKSGIYALVGGYVWDLRYNGVGFDWRDTGMTEEEYFSASKSGSITLNLLKDDIVVIDCPPAGNSAEIRFKESNFTFRWQAKGDTVTMPVLSPEAVGTSLLRKIADGKVNARVRISRFDERVKGTYLVAAESARDLAVQKLHTSFNDFCTWLSVVFGYVYTISDTSAPDYTILKRFGTIVGTPYTPEGAYEGDVDPSEICYNKRTACFFYHADGKYYKTWTGCDEYNGTDGHPRTDTVFFEGNKSRYWTFKEYDNTDLAPDEYDYDESVFGKECQVVNFIHRSELFKNDAVSFEHCRDIEYSVNASVLYSSVTAGYDKKDYDSVNGRDEFNFNSTYTTGCTVSDKKLTLQSKYRADSYGLEFAVQKRGEDTSDTTSDKDVFFLLCKKSGNQLIPDRTIGIDGSLTPYVFNGAYSPMACVRANAGYIGLQTPGMTLRYASTEGNDCIVIDDEPITSDITLESSIATCGIVKFSTDEVKMPLVTDNLIEVVGDGITYRGYIAEADFMFARTASAKYKLLVKEVVVS